LIREALMLLTLDGMLDEAEVYVFVATWPLTSVEREAVIALHDAWLLLWSTVNHCSASHCYALFHGQLTYWAVDMSPRPEPHRVLTGSELDLLFRPLEAFGAVATPPVEVLPQPALIVNGHEVLTGEALRDRVKRGDVPPVALVVDGCSVQAWRAGQMVHPLKDDRAWAEKLLPHRANDSQADSTLSAEPSSADFFK
jgi:hypothetical protein